MSSDPADYESPRQRRERIFVRKRSRRRFGLIGGGIALLIFAIGVWAFSHFSSSGPPVSAEVPLLRADEQPTRKRPSDAGGMNVPERDSIVLNRSEPSVEQLLPPPETPLPRPATSEPPAAEPPAAAAPPPEQPLPPEQPSVATTATPVAPPPSAAPSAPEAKPAPEPKAVPEPKVARAAAPPPPAPMPASGKGYRLQLGSVRTAEAAKHEWDRLKDEQGDLLGALGFTAARADLGDRGIYYRIQAGPIADSAAAERDCSELKRRGVGCILVKP
jgi:cell division septation protein DedD